MIDCCIIALGLVIANLISVIVLSGRTLKAEARVTKLEKKNGKELAEIEKLKKRLAELEKGGQHD